MVHPKYVLVLCAIIAVILMPTLVFLRVMALGMVANAVIVGSLCALYTGYRAWFESRQKT